MGETVFPLPAVGESIAETYTRFRQAGPVVPVELPQGVRVWAVTTHAAVREVLDNEGTLFGKHSSHWGALRDGTVPEQWPFMPLVLGEHMLMRDGAEHLRLRGLLSQSFSAAQVEALRPRVSEITDELVAAIATKAADGATVDLMPALAEPLPIAVICELFGIPGPQRAQLRGWTQALFSHQNSPEQTHAAGRDLIGYLTELAERKRHQPGEDLTTALVHGQDDDRLSMRELVDCLFLLIIAGHETTVHLIGHALVGMLSHPAQLDLALAEDRWADVVEEALRRTPPVAASLFRYALSPVKLGGVSIAAGDALLLCLAGAGTDPAHHGPDADQFDITRDQRGHLAFGHGPHFCLGAPLARLEARTALSAVFTRLPGMKSVLSFDDIPYSPSFLTCGPVSVPVVTPPAAA